MKLKNIRGLDVLWIRLPAPDVGWLRVNVHQPSCPSTFIPIDHCYHQLLYPLILAPINHWLIAIFCCCLLFLSTLPQLELDSVVAPSCFYYFLVLWCLDRFKHFVEVVTNSQIISRRRDRELTLIDLLQKYKQLHKYKTAIYFYSILYWCLFSLFFSKHTHQTFILCIHLSITDLYEKYIEYWNLRLLKQFKTLHGSLHLH